MAGVLNTSMAYEQRSVIRFLHSKGRTPIEIYRGMQPTYGERCLALRSMRWWCSEFENGRENPNDNVRPHVANKTVNKLRKFHWEFLKHPPYSPDLAPSDFHLFSPLKKFLAGQRFTCDDKVEAAVRQWFRSQTADFYCSGIAKLVLRWDKCMNRHGEYVEKY